jgi:GNAT superfamily N-acetyltransferase
VPVHPHDRSEGLEPEGIAEAREQGGTTVVVDHGLRDRRAKRDHALGEPGGHAPAVQREVGDAGALHPCILPPTRDDLEAAVGLLGTLGLFGPDDLAEVGGLLEAFVDGRGPAHDVWLIDDEDDGTAAIAYVAPERMTAGTWNLYLLGVHPARQRGGRGAAMVRHVETVVRGRGARLLLVETLGLPEFEPQRAFYRRCGFDEEARIRDFYDHGADKVVFRRLVGAGQDR